MYLSCTHIDVRHTLIFDTIYYPYACIKHNRKQLVFGFFIILRFSTSMSSSISSKI